MNPKSTLAKFEQTNIDLQTANINTLIELATEKQVYGILSKIWLSSYEKYQTENIPIWEFLSKLDYGKQANFRESLRSLLSIDSLWVITRSI